jgi:hypothetical protein
METLILVVSGIVLYAIGVASGMYVSSQLEKNIDKRICDCNGYQQDDGAYMYDDPEDDCMDNQK